MTVVAVTAMMVVMVFMAMVTAVVGTDSPIMTSVMTAVMMASKVRD